MKNILAVVAIGIILTCVAVIITSVAFDLALHALKDWHTYRGDSPCLLYR